MTDALEVVADETRLTEASEWFVRLREAAVTNEVITDWLQWCGEHPDNARAYYRVQEIWSLARDAGVRDWPDAAQVRADPYRAEVSVADWMRGERQVRDDRGAAAVVVKKNAYRRVAVYLIPVAAALALAVGTWLLVPYLLNAWFSREYSTARAATREIRLGDGSQVTLGGASSIRVDYRNDRRDIRLDSGEAFFKVQHDPSRPFVVRTSDLQVAARGTQFTVRADDARTVVSVTEGVVEISRLVASSASEAPHAPIPPAKLLDARAGEQVTFDSHVGSPAVRPADTAEALGWEEGALSSVDEPLRTVIARVNRYSSRRIVLAGPEVGELHFTGTVLENQIPEWADGLERVFPVRVTHRADGTIALESRSKETTH